MIKCLRLSEDGLALTEGSSGPTGIKLANGNEIASSAAVLLEGFGLKLRDLSAEPVALTVPDPSAQHRAALEQAVNDDRIAAWQVRCVPAGYIATIEVRPAQVAWRSNYWRTEAEALAAAAAHVAGLRREKLPEPEEMSHKERCVELLGRGWEMTWGEDMKPAWFKFNVGFAESGSWETVTLEALREARAHAEVEK